MVDAIQASPEEKGDGKDAEERALNNKQRLPSWRENAVFGEHESKPETKGNEEEIDEDIANKAMPP